MGQDVGHEEPVGGDELRRTYDGYSLGTMSRHSNGLDTTTLNWPFAFLIRFAFLRARSMYIFG